MNKSKVNSNLLSNIMKSPTTRSKVEPFTISATDGQGKSLTQAKIGRTVRMSKKDKDMELINQLTKDVDFDIEKKAIEVMSYPSPAGTR